MSADVRLDAATLEWCAKGIRSTIANTLEEGRNSHPDSFWGGFSEGLDKLAAEAASRPPTLSDWVRACEVSKLGTPRWRREEESRDHIIGAFAEHDITIGLSLRYDNSGVQPHKGGEYMGFTCATPAALTAALDALAGA